MASNGDWKTYFLGIFAAVILALTGSAYSSVTSRVAKLETIHADTNKENNGMAVQIAVMSNEIASLTSQVSDLRTDVNSLHRQVTDLTFIISKNTKVYQDAMVRWNEELKSRPAAKRD